MTKVISEEDLAKNVRKSFYVSDRTKIKFTIGGVLAICATIVCSTWTARGYVEDFKQDLVRQFDDLKTSQDKMTTALNYKWSAGQMEQWAHDLDAANRDLSRPTGKTGLIVPEPLNYALKPAP